MTLSIHKRMRAIALGVFLLSSLGVSSSFAQDPATKASPSSMAGGQHHGHGSYGDKCGAMKELNLTDSQKAQMKAQHEAFRSQHAAQFSSMKAKREQIKQLGSDPAKQTEKQKLMAELRQERMALMAQRKASLKNILTPEQMSKMESAKAKCKAAHKGEHRGGQYGGHHMDKSDDAAKP